MSKEEINIRIRKIMTSIFSKKAKIFKSLKITGSVVFYTFIVIVLLFSIANIRKSDKNDISNLFGTGFLTVQSDSMSGSKSNSFNKGDLLFVQRITTSNRTKIISELQIGDIVTFVDDGILSSSSNQLNTHRVVNIFTNSEGYVIIHTQGDFAAEHLAVYNSSSTDWAESVSLNSGIDYQEFLSSRVVGVYTGKISGFGTFVTSLTEPYSVQFILVIVLPILAFFLFELVMVIKNVFSLKNEKNKGLLEADKEKMILELEAQKEAMRQEILEQIKKEQEIKSSNEVTKEDEKK